jgi:hypothetical protein
MERCPQRTHGGGCSEAGKQPAHAKEDVSRRASCNNNTGIYKRLTLLRVGD